MFLELSSDSCHHKQLGISFQCLLSYLNQIKKGASLVSALLDNYAVVCLPKDQGLTQGHYFSPFFNIAPVVIFSSISSSLLSIACAEANIATSMMIDIHVINKYIVIVLHQFLELLV